MAIAAPVAALCDGAGAIDLAKVIAIVGVGPLGRLRARATGCSSATRSLSGLAGTMAAVAIAGIALVPAPRMLVRLVV